MHANKQIFPLVGALSLLLLVAFPLGNTTQAALITFGGTAIQNAKDHNGGALMAGRLSFLVVDTTGNGFASLLRDMLIQPGAFIPGTDDYVIQTNQTSTGTFGSLVPGAASNFPNDANGIDVGDPFGVYFFEDSSLDADGKMSAPLVADAYYGFASLSDWTVPSGVANPYSFTNTGMGADFKAASGISTTMQVSAIPEPNGTWLLGIVSVLYTFGLRRQRAGGHEA